MINRGNGVEEEERQEKVVSGEEKVQEEVEMEMHRQTGGPKEKELNVCETHSWCRGSKKKMF